MTGDGHDEYVAGLLHRTTMLLGEAAMARLRDRTVAVAGCGGVGGATAITLARLGVGGFVLADPGIFDPPDLNRQWAGTRATLGRNKTEVHAELLRAINPRVRLTLFPDGVDAENLDDFLAPADLLLDCLDISVPLELRGEVYRRAQARGLYAVSAPIFGFGTMILFAEPGGMGMDELIAGFVRVASTASKLPPGFPDFWFEPHVRAIEREIHKHRVPTSGVAVTLASGLVAAEIARVFLRDLHPELGGPPALPKVMAVDPLRRTFRVMHHRELFRDLPPGREARALALARAGHQGVRLDHHQVARDWLSDSGADLPPVPIEPSDEDPAALAAELYGVPRAATVFRGRYAEALLAPLVVRPGRVVLCNALFPTTRFHVEAAGGRLVEVGGADLDLDRVARELRTGEVGTIWVEPCSNAAGGLPLSVEHLAAVRQLAEAARVPLVLDTTRIFANAAQLEGPIGETVRALCALADACAGSLTKDLRTPVGGLLLARSEPLWLALRDRVQLMTGDGLSAEQRAVLAGSLRLALDRGTGAAERLDAVRSLSARLAAVGAPVIAGGHAVFVDASRALPHLAPDEHPDLALANALYVEAGIRVAPNLRTPDRPDQRWVRCAVPVGRRDPAAADHLVDTMAAVLARAGEIRGLEPDGEGPGGVLGRFARPYRVRP